MNDHNSVTPVPRKTSVWTEGAKIVPKETLIPAKSPDSSDDIPTIPDLDDFQDILEKEISKPPINWLQPHQVINETENLQRDLASLRALRFPQPHRTKQADLETVNALAEVSSGYGGSGDSLEAALNQLRSHIPQVEPDTSDSVWTIDSLLAQLMEEDRVND